MVRRSEMKQMITEQSLETRCVDMLSRDDGIGERGAEVIKNFLAELHALEKEDQKNRVERRKKASERFKKRSAKKRRGVKKNKDHLSLVKLETNSD